MDDTAATDRWWVISLLVSAEDAEAAVRAEGLLRVTMLNDSPVCPIQSTVIRFSELDPRQQQQWERLEALDDEVWG